MFSNPFLIKFALVLVEQKILSVITIKVLLFVLFFPEIFEVTWHFGAFSSCQLMILKNPTCSSQITMLVRLFFYVVWNNLWLFVFRNLKLKPQIFTGGTDSRYIRQLGLSAIGFSPMNNTPVLLHDNDEYIGVDTFLKGIEIYRKIITEVANVEDRTGWNKKKNMHEEQKKIAMKKKQKLFYYYY